VPFAFYSAFIEHQFINTLSALWLYLKIFRPALTTLYYYLFVAAQWFAFEHPADRKDVDGDTRLVLIIHAGKDAAR